LTVDRLKFTVVKMMASTAVTSTPTKRGEESKHFTSLQIFTSYAEPPLDEYIDRDEQVKKQTDRQTDRQIERKKKRICKS
jgi:S-adenosylmethionine:tRNA-ribosyltransferase-isomerase (queuine synthetase)